MRKTVRTVALGALASSFLLAQIYSGSTGTAPTVAQIVARQVARLTSLLTLTSSQQAQATSIFTTEQTALASLRTTLDAAHTSLDTAVESDSTGDITTLAAQIGTLQGQQVLAQATADAAFYAILTSSQQTTYNNLKLGGLLGGPGGPGGPGPGGFGGPHP